MKKCKTSSNRKHMRSPSIDGPATDLFAPVVFTGGTSSLSAIRHPTVSTAMAEAWKRAPLGDCICHGIPFEIGPRVILAVNKPVFVSMKPVLAPWLAILHTSDIEKNPISWDADLAANRIAFEHAFEPLANYILVYDDGSEAVSTVQRRHHIGSFDNHWGNSFLTVKTHIKQHSCRAHHEQMDPAWGRSQTRVVGHPTGPWINWVMALENRCPHKKIIGMRIEARDIPVVISAISYGSTKIHPLHWNPREKAIVTLPSNMDFNPTLNEHGVLAQIQIDLGQIISAEKRTRYPNRTWSHTSVNAVPEIAANEILIEYTAHPQASLHIAGKRPIPLERVGKRDNRSIVTSVAPSRQRVRLRVVEQGGTKPIAVKLHMHGRSDEYLAPVDRHRIPNDAWFEDYSTDFVHLGLHRCTYIPGETTIDLPLGPVYVEISKGFEVKPLRTVVQVTRATNEITITVERALRWREQGWITADTHVHFLSPQTALLEGAAEGVNVVNLLASQWGELMTNVGDYDGRTTHGSHEAGGDGEYLVRVGTENRQNILGHISLVGYEGNIIAPMTTSGPPESALGDPLDALVSEWARRCRAQNGVVVIPHFPSTRTEHAALVISGDVDAVEMTSWGNLYNGISALSLASWYGYLNCGYFVPAVGGTDKMSANTPIGAIRTYARIENGKPFTYEEWKSAIRRGNTFVTYGPLVEMTVDGKLPGTRMSMKAGGGTVDIAWRAESVTVPITSVDLIINGEVRASARPESGGGAGHWSIPLNRSSWIAILVRGKYSGKKEMIAAHTSPVMVSVEGTEFYAAMDAVSILEQIEGAIAYLDTMRTRTEATAFKRMQLILTGAHRMIHNRLHQHGHYHMHTPATNHEEHKQ